MFAKACEKVYKFTRPVIVSTRRVDGKVDSACATFFVVNREGWALTAGHVFDPAMKFREDQKKIREVQQSNAGRPPSDSVPGAPHLPGALPLSPDWITNQSFWWGADGISIDKAFVYRDVDLALVKLKGFRPEWISEYPVFRDPDTLFPGTSLCRVGFPFVDVGMTFDEASKTFRIKPGVLPMPIFPNDGIHTRNIVKKNRSVEGHYEIIYVETSTPGLKGQSGGPIFDTEGRIYAMQVSTSHIPLGFHPYVEYEGKKVVENQFINVGLGVHTKLIQQIMRDKGVSFRTEGGKSDGDNYVIND